MRNRLFDISVVLAGVAIAVAVYPFREGRAPDEMHPEFRSTATIETPAAPARLMPAPGVQYASTPDARTAEPDRPVIDPVEFEAARSVWQSAVADLEAVESELDELDSRFDAREAQLSEREARGMDPDAAEEEMLIFLDGIVDEYDALETRLEEAEDFEAEAAERLAELSGDTTRYDSS